MTDNTEALPPLPEEADWSKYDGRRIDLYTADQMRNYARAALAQRQQVPDAIAALLRIASRLENMGRPQAANGVRLAILELEKDAALRAAPSAQAEPVAWQFRNSANTNGRWGWCSEEEARRWGAEGVEVRALYAAPPSAQAEPQVPLPDDQVLAIFREAVDGNTIKLTRDVGPYEVTEPTHAARKLVNAIVAAAHGIGKQEGK